MENEKALPLFREGKGGLTFDFCKKYQLSGHKVKVAHFFIFIVILIKIETKIEHNKIKSTRNYFELCLTVQTSDKK